MKTGENKSFRHSFNGMETDAVYWVNPDGSKGGIVSTGAVIDPSAIVKKDATVGLCTQILEGAIIEESVQIGAFTYIGAGVKVGKLSQLGNYCVIHANCDIESGAIINSYAHLDEGVTVGKQAKIGLRAMLGKKVRVTANNEVFDHLIVLDGEVV